MTRRRPGGASSREPRTEARRPRSPLGAFGPFLLYVAAALALPSSPRAELVGQAPRVLLSLLDCPGDEPELRQLTAALRVELATAGVVAEPCPAGVACEAGEAAAVLTVELVGCELGGGLALLRLVGGGLPPSERPVPLDDALPEARVRTVALAAGELYRDRARGAAAASAGDVPEPREPPPSEEPEVPARAPPAEDEAGPARRDLEALLPPPCPDPAGVAARHGRLLWGLAFSALAFPSAGPAQVGLRVGVTARLGEHLPLWLAADGGVAYAGGEDPLGRIDAVTATAALAISYGVELGPALLLLGPRAELGWTHGFGTAASPDVTARDADDLVALLTAEARVELRLSGRASLSLAVGGGGVVTPLELLAAGRAVVSQRGALVVARLGLSFGSS